MSDRALPEDDTEITENAAALRRLLKERLAGTDGGKSIPPAPEDFPVSLKSLLGEGYRETLHPAGVLIPIIERSGGPTILLTKRSEALNSHAGQIAFPGGGKESSDASLTATALREAHEEVGLESEHVDIVGYLDNYPTTSRFLITPVVGMVDTQARFHADGVEATEVFEVPLDHVLDFQRYRRETIHRQGYDLPFYTLDYGQYRIWGATAGMLLNLRAKILDKPDTVE